MTRRKKILLAILILLIGAGLAYYFLVYRKAPSPTIPVASPRFGFLPPTLRRLFGGGGAGGRQPGGTTGGTGTSPTPPLPAERLKQKLYHISTEPAFAPAVNSTGNTVRFFLRSTGHLWETDYEWLALQRLTDTPFQNLLEAVWSQGGDTVVLTIMDATGTLRKYFFDVAAKKSVELNRFVRSVAFSPKGNRIAYHYLNTANGDDAVAVANPDGTKFKNIFAPIFDDFTLAWPKEETIIIQTKPSYFSQTRVYALDARSGALSKALPQDYPGLASVWSPNGARFLASRTDAEGQLQTTLTGALPQIQPRELFGTNTLAEKCVWKKDNTTVICGLPTNIPQFDGLLPDSYYKGVLITVDDVREINIETLASRTLARAQELYPNLDIDEPVLSPDETKLFFVNRQDGFIYALRLTP